jgi:hypothetical protein
MYLFTTIREVDGSGFPSFRRQTSHLTNILFLSHLKVALLTYLLIYLLN